MMHTIAKIRIASLARIVTLIVVVLHVLLGAVLALVFTGVIHIFTTIPSAGLGPWALYLLWLACTIPVAIVAYILGCLIGVIYNTTASWWGGIRFELAESKPKKAPRQVQREEQPPVKSEKKGTREHTETRSKTVDGTSQ